MEDPTLPALPTLPKLLPANTSTKVQNILYLDARADRRTLFRVSGGSCFVRYCDTLTDSRRVLNGVSKWDVVFYSGYLGDWEQDNWLVPDLVDAYKAGKIRAVILFSPIEKSGLEALRGLKKANVPAIYAPFNFMHPEQHDLRKL
jgi:hypothetical protein